MPITHEPRIEAMRSGESLTTPLPVGAGDAGEFSAHIDTIAVHSGSRVPLDTLRRTRPRALLAATRPRQWIKNGLVVAAPGAAGVLGRDHVPTRVAIAFLAFCLLSAGTYIVNDVRDAHEDRRHPRKRLRPVAAGELDPPFALIAAAVLMLAGLGLCLAVRSWLAAVGLAYVALTLTYTVVWRHVVILDVAAIAGGFFLRAVAGGAAAPVHLSRWFLLVVTFGAVFVACGKRSAELQRASAARVGARRVLERYGAARLRLILIASAAGAFAAYCAWAFELPAVGGVPWRPLTVVPFAACLLRYGALVRSGEGEAPEELLLEDRGLQLASIAWLVVFALGVHAAG